MGLAQADVAERDATTAPPGTAPQAVARVYENYLQVIVREDAAVQQISDLQARRFSIGPRWSARSRALSLALRQWLVADDDHRDPDDGAPTGGGSC